MAYSLASSLVSLSTYSLQSQDAQRTFTRYKKNPRPRNLRNNILPMHRLSIMHVVSVHAFLLFYREKPACLMITCEKAKQNGALQRSASM